MFQCRRLAGFFVAGRNRDTVSVSVRFVIMLERKVHLDEIRTLELIVKVFIERITTVSLFSP